MQKARRQIRSQSRTRLLNTCKKSRYQEVLEDRSPSYDGTVQAAEEYLKRTYNRLRLSPQHCQSARELYDTCDWSQPSEDQINFLNRAPTQQELEAKLRRATNTSPGVDGLEYRHLRSHRPQLHSVGNTWLDMCNAFGSVPHAVLNELFTSLPIPENLWRILVDIYSGNRMDFAVGKESIRIFPTAGVRQGDALSSPNFNLALPSPSSGPESPILTPDFYYLKRS
ncbi:hypothetical protein OUZ56_025949 [Daphnia magna]|uniref:Reverse transcriptase domain-containing protein n=1 Tax=Daphnia magna TaxID=35525 RepID=A0ABQ9ZLD9_9CRUS|nr:hypothetical protein OUZ56_025949 [Daphnia magna]